MKRHRRNTTTVTRYVEIEVECEVEIEPGEKEIRWGDNACPGSAPSAEILSAQVDGIDVMKLLSENDIRAIEDEAIEQMADDEEDAREAAAEARADARRERRLLGD